MSTSTFANGGATFEDRADILDMVKVYPFFVENFRPFGWKRGTKHVTIRAIWGDDALRNSYQRQKYAKRLDYAASLLSAIVPPSEWTGA